MFNGVGFHAYSITFVIMEIIKFIRDTPLENCYQPIFKNWWPIGEAIQATASHINSAINFFANRETNKANERINQQQIEYAREAFEKEKDYNNWLLGNQRQLQMNDSKAAGVNPAFMSGSSLGGVSNPARMDVPSQIPMNYNFDASGISEGISKALDYFLQKKQVDANVSNLYADTQKKLSENDLLKIEKTYLPAMRRGQIAIMESNIAVNGSNIKLNDQECNLVAMTTMAKKQELDQIMAKTAEIKANMENIQADTRLKQIESLWKSQEMQATIENLRASAHLSMQSARDLVATRVLRLANLQADLEKKAAEFLNISADTAKKQEEISVVKINGDQLQFDLDSDKSFKNAERIVGLINGSVNVLKTINDLIISWVPLGKLGKVAEAVSKAPKKTSPVDTPPAPFE